MWQCHTYSHPKLVRVLTIGSVGLPFASVFLNPIVKPSGSIGLSGRSLLVTSNGKTGMIGRSATIVSSSGLIRSVSFQPSSLASGGRMMPSQPTRLMTWTSKRWKWIGCVSTPLWVIFQSCVPSLATEIGCTS